jgi:hypothetical protein
MKVFEHLIKSVGLVILISAFAATGLLSSQLMAVEKVKKQKKVKKAKKTKKTPKAKKSTAKKAAKKPAKKKAVVKKDKVVVEETEFERILKDPNAGEWELLPRGEGNEELSLDILAVGPDKVLYGVDKEAKDLYVNEGSGWVRKIEGSINFVTVAVDGAVLLLNDEGEIFQYNNESGEREKLAGSAHSWDNIAALNTSMIWAIEYEAGQTHGKVYSFQSTRWSSGWMPVNNDAGEQTQGIRDVFVAPGELWLIDADGKTYVKDIEEWKTGLFGLGGLF